MGNCLDNTTQNTQQNKAKQKKKGSLRNEDSQVIKPNKSKAVGKQNKKFDIKVENCDDRKMTLAQQFLDDNYRDFKSLGLVDDRSIKAKCRAYVFGRAHMTEQSQFKITFNCINDYVSLGVVDSRYKKKPVLDTNTRNWITYCSDGRYYLGGKKMSSINGFKVGEEITVLLDRKMGEIKWIIRGQSIFDTKFSGLNDKALNWVPFIQLKQPDDAFTISN